MEDKLPHSYIKRLELKEKIAFDEFELALDDLIGYLRVKAGFNEDQPRDDHGRWTSEGGGSGSGGGDGTAPKPSSELPYSTPDGYNYGSKIKRQMGSRGWTDSEIDDAQKYGDRIDAINKA